MEGSAEDTWAPDSWEMADLDESTGRLMLLSSSQKKRLIPSNLEFANELPSDSLPAADAAGGSSGDAFAQVDQFLREALEKPRERLPSICKDLILVVDLVEHPAPFNHYSRLQ